MYSLPGEEALQLSTNGTDFFGNILPIPMTKELQELQDIIVKERNGQGKNKKVQGNKVQGKRRENRNRRKSTKKKGAPGRRTPKRPSVEKKMKNGMNGNYGNNNIGRMGRESPILKARTQSLSKSKP